MSNVSKIVLVVIFALIIGGGIFGGRKLDRQQQLVDVTLTARVDQLAGRIDAMPNEGKVAREQMEILLRDLEFRMKALDAKNPEATIATLQEQIKGLDARISKIREEYDQHSHAIIAKDKKGNPVAVRNSVLPPEAMKKGPINVAPAK